MNSALILGFTRQRLTSPFRVALLAFMFGMPLLLATAAPALGLQPFRDISGLALVFAAGAIGQDVSSGVLHLLFARPVSRAEYVTSRWLAAAILATVAALAQLAIGCGILALRGAAPDGTQAGLLAAEHVLRAFGIVAVMLLLSSLVNGIGDLGVYFVAVFTAMLVGQLGPVLGARWLGRVAEEVQRFLGPSLELGGFARGDPVSAFAVISYVSTVTLCLALAIVVMNRRELTYASG